VLEDDVRLCLEHVVEKIDCACKHLPIYVYIYLCILEQSVQQSMMRNAIMNFCEHHKIHD